MGIPAPQLSTSPPDEFTKWLVTSVHVYGCQTRDWIQDNTTGSFLLPDFTTLRSTDPDAQRRAQELILEIIEVRKRIGMRL